VLTRFAPAPTGWLHLGHVANAHLVWQFARERHGRVLLRIEDHDRLRCRREYEAGILDDLDWLGFAPDIFPTDAFRAGRCDGRQSDRDAQYRAAVDILLAQGLVYGCDCSRRQIAETRGASNERRAKGEERRAGGEERKATGDQGELRYSGRCRARGIGLKDGVGWRVRMDPGVERFVDERLGPQAQDPSAQCGDVLIRDRHGHWTYQLCVTVDDWKQGIDFVVRGEDLLASTGRQIRLARLFGRTHPPTFLHHPLIMKSSSQKLSKSDGDSGIRDLRLRGWTPEQVRAAARRTV
jgi:glutamyl/glutaminyl-tRNA synthetase